MLLGTPCLLAGCQLTSSTRIAVTEAAIIRDTCLHAWRPTTYSSRDTPETQLGNRANNAARAKWCEGVDAP